MIKELNDKGISLDKLNKLNNEYEQIVQEMTKELNNKNISLNEYKENINELDNEHKKEIQELKTKLKESNEYIDSDKKDKDKVIKKINELSKEQQKYIEEKKIEQELNEKEQELNDLKKSINLKNKEINELKNEDSSTPTKIPQIVRKKDDKDFKKDSLPKYNEKIDRLKNLEKEYQNINMPPLKKVNLNMPNMPPLEKINIKDLEKTMKKKKDFYNYELNISDSRIKYFDKIIKENPKMSAKKIDILNHLKSLYVFRKNYFEVKINNPKTKTPSLRQLDYKIRKLEDEFREQKGSRTFT